MAKKIRTAIRDLEHLSFGFRVGYWPCLKGPYVQIVFAGYRLEVWWGLPSYKNDKKSRKKPALSVR